MPTINKYIKLCLVICLSLLLCEISLRVYFFLSHKNILASTSPDRLLNEKHPFLEYALRPNVTLSQRNRTIHINSLGFRGKEFNPDDASPFRVFVLGGSSVFNIPTDDNPGFCVILEQKLRAKYPGRDIEIVNAGVSGYTTYHSLINLSTRILDYNPDAIIVYHSWNDIKLWPYLNRRANYPELYLSIYRPLKTSLALRTLINNSYLWLAIKPLRHALHRSFHRKTGTRSLVAKVFTPNAEGDVEYGKLIYKRNIRNIVTTALNSDVQVLLVNPLTLIRPDNSQDEIERIDFNRVKVDPQRLPRLMSDAGQILQEVAQEEHVPYIDLNKHIGQNLENMIDHIHLTSRGNQAVAEYLSRHWDEIWHE